MVNVLTYTGGSCLISTAAINGSTYLPLLHRKGQALLDFLRLTLNGGRGRRRRAREQPARLGVLVQVPQPASGRRLLNQLTSPQCAQSLLRDCAMVAWDV